MNKLFKPNFDKKQFTISIDVFENGLSFTITPAEKTPMYYEVLGVIHQMLYSVMEDQRKESKNEFAKLTKSLK